MPQHSSLQTMTTVAATGSCSVGRLPRSESVSLGSARPTACSFGSGPRARPEIPTSVPSLIYIQRLRYAWKSFAPKCRKTARTGAAICLLKAAAACASEARALVVRQVMTGSSQRSDKSGFFKEQHTEATYAIQGPNPQTVAPEPIRPKNLSKLSDPATPKFQTSSQPESRETQGGRLPSLC